MDDITLTEYISMNNANILEGYSQQITRQVEILKECCSNATEILEIGFNAGHSAEVFLKVNSNVRVTSFDIGHGEQLDFGKNYIDIKNLDFEYV